MFLLTIWNKSVSNTIRKSIAICEKKYITEKKKHAIPISMTNLFLRIYYMSIFLLSFRWIMTINHRTHHYQRHRKFNICGISLSSKHCKRERLYSNWCRFVSNWSAKRMHVLKHRCVLILALFIHRISYACSFVCLFVYLFLFGLESNKIMCYVFFFFALPVSVPVPVYIRPSFSKCCEPLGKNATITTAESRVTGAFGFSRRLHIHGKWTGWPNIGKHKLGTTGILMLL